MHASPTNGGASMSRFWQEHTGCPGSALVHALQSMPSYSPQCSRLAPFAEEEAAASAADRPSPTAVGLRARNPPMWPPRKGSQHQLPLCTVALHQ